MGGERRRLSNRADNGRREEGRGSRITEHIERGERRKEA